MRAKLVIFLAIICIALSGLVIWTRVNTDREGPEIIFGESEIVYSDDMDPEELLTDVTAEDDVDGDVTDSLTVESVYPVSDEAAVAVYVAKDSKNNVTKAKREISYRADGTGDDSETASADQTTDEETSDEEENLSQETNADDPELTPTPEVSPTQSALSEEEQAREEQEALAEAMPAQSPRLYLTDYIVHVNRGESVNKLDYVKEIQDDDDNISELWHYIRVEGNLDVNVSGTYELSYYVTDLNGNRSNIALLKVIVE